MIPRSIFFNNKLLAASIGLVLYNASSAQSVEWADLQIRFVFDTNSDEQFDESLSDYDDYCGKGRLPKTFLSQELVVNRENRGIKNLAFFPVTKSSNIADEDIHPDLKNHVDTVSLTIEDCAYSPRILALHPSQTIEIAKEQHVPHHTSLRVPPNSFRLRRNIKANQDSLQFPNALSSPVPVECVLHPRMKAFIFVFELPYFGVSDDDGVVRIEKLPAGKPIVFRLWHELLKSNSCKLSLNGKDAQWNRWLPTLSLKPGLNDLGVLTITSDP